MSSNIATRETLCSCASICGTHLDDFFCFSGRHVEWCTQILRRFRLSLGTAMGGPSQSCCPTDWSITEGGWLFRFILMRRLAFFLLTISCMNTHFSHKHVKDKMLFFEHPHLQYLKCFAARRHHEAFYELGMLPFSSLNLCLVKQLSHFCLLPFLKRKAKEILELECTSYFLTLRRKSIRIMN